MEENRESYWDYMRREVYEGRTKLLSREDMWKKEVADMQEQVHGLQLRVKELSEELNKIKYINTEKEDINQMKMEF